MHNENRSRQTQTQTSAVSNLNIEGNEGIALANSSGNSITTTDFGAISAAADISSDAIAMGRVAVEAGNDVAIAGLDNAQRAYQGSLDFAGDVFSGASAAIEGSADRVARFASDALTSQSGIAGRAIDAVTDAGAGVLDFASGLFSDALGAQKLLTDQNLSGLTTLARQTSSSADDRVQKVALYAFIAVAAIMVLPRLFR